MNSLPLSRCLSTWVLLCITLTFTATAPLHAEIGAGWRLRSPKPWSGRISSLIGLGSSRIVAAAEGGVALLSKDDGQTWTATQLTSGYPTVYGDARMAWNGATGSSSKLLFVSDGRVWSSTRGDDWSPLTTNLNSLSQVSVGPVIWAGNQWAVLDYAYTNKFRILTSIDGISWSVLTVLPVASADTSINSIVWSSSGYVLTGSHTVGNRSQGLFLHTTDGTKWDSLLLNPETESHDLHQLIWTGTRFVANGFFYNTSKLYSSIDGVTWISSPVDFGVSDLLWTGNSVIAVGAGESLVSPDGVDWSGSPVVFSNSYSNPLLAWTGSKILAMTDVGNVFLSTTGQAWNTIVTTPGSWRCMTSDGAGKLVGFTWNDQTPFYSTNGGETWTASTDTATAGTVTWDGTAFVALDGTNQAWSSMDGISWSPITSPNVGNPIVAAKPGMLVAVGYGDVGEGAIATSSDHGSTWTTRTVPAGTQGLRNVSWVGNLWVAVGESGTVVTSPDAKVWTKRTSNASYDLGTVAGRPGLIVALDTDNEIITSTNGLTWTKHTVTDDYPIYNIVWTGSNFVGRGSEVSVMYTSNDGVKWTTHPTHFNGYQYLLIWDGSQVICGGNSVITSDALPVAEFVRTSSRVFEGAGTVEVAVQLSSAASTPLTLPLAFSGTATSPTDYGTVAASLTFAPGETLKTIAIPVVNNSTVGDGDRSLTLSLGEGAGWRVGQAASHTLIISDDDTPPPVNFSSTGVQVTESAGSVGVRVELGWPAPGPVSVTLALSGTADASDHGTIPATVNFAAGESLKFLSIPITDDTLEEPGADELLTLTLQNPTGAVLGTFTDFTISIQDNDPVNSLGNQWRVSNPSPAAEPYEAIASNGTTKVIVGDNGLILTSTDGGLNWTRRSSGSHNHYVSVTAYGNGFVATGGHSAIAASPDGVTWSETTLQGGDFALYSCGAHGSQLIVAGVPTTSSFGASPVIFTSTDLVHWQQGIVPATAHGVPNSLVWNGSQYAMVGGDTHYDLVGSDATLILTSVDGNLWVDHSSAISPPVNLQNVVWAGNAFVAFANKTACFTSNADGSVWAPHSAGAKAISAGVATGSKILAVGDGIASSTNGISWTQKASPADSRLNAVTRDGSGLYVAISKADIYSSNDGLAWTRCTRGLTHRGALNSVVWSGSQYLAVGALTMTSPDGVSWSQVSGMPNAMYYGVTWSGSLFVAVGRNGAVATSPDGKAWTTRTSGVTDTLRDVIWTGAQFVAVGGVQQTFKDTAAPSGIVLTSPNGITWTRQSIPTNKVLESIVFTGSQYVAVGHYADGMNTLVTSDGNAEILTSPDAIHWTHRDSGLSELNLTHVAWNGSVFVAGSEGTHFIHSNDGVTWTPASHVPTQPPSNADFEQTNDSHGLCWAGGRFHAVCDRGRVYSSVDGDVWKMVNTDTTLSLHSVCTNGVNALVCVGESGLIELNTIAAGLGSPPAAVFEAASSTVSEHDGVANIAVIIDPPPTTRLKVFFHKASQTGTNNANAALPASPLTFNPGETRKYLSIPLKNDATVEGSSTVTLVLDPSSAVGSASVDNAHASHVLTITDDDVIPSITSPAPVLVPVGGYINTWCTVTGGFPVPTLQWFKGATQPAKSKIAGATGTTYAQSTASLADAGYLTFTATNTAGFATASCPVGVYEKVTRNITSTAAKDITFTQTAAGPGLLFKWYHTVGSSTAMVTNDSHSVISRASLTLKQPLASSDEGYYECRVSTSPAGPEIAANGWNFGIVSGKPTFTPTVLTLPNEQVAQAYQSNALTALLPAKSVVTWSATDLPPGLSIDPVTGAITGYPTKAVTNQSVTVTVSNSVGSTIILPKPTIAILPPAEGLAGAWKAVVARDPYINNNLGSRLDITITADGSYTGKFTTGAASTSFTGLHAYHDIVGPTVTASSNLTFSGNVRGNLSFSFDTTSSIPSMVGQITVYPTDGSAPVNHPFTAWQARSTPGHYTGAHNFALQLQAPQLGNIAVPQGDGFGTATVDSKGVVTILGKTADGSSFTCSSPLGGHGEFILYSILYGGKGSLVASSVLTLGTATDFSDTTLTASDASWNKPPDTTSLGALKYPSGWSAIPLSLAGAKYAPPQTGSDEIVLGLSPPLSFTDSNANLDFSGAGLEKDAVSPSRGIQVTSPANVSLNWPAGDRRVQSLVIDPAKGTFHGGFSHSVLTFTVPFEGLLVHFIGGSPEYAAHGYFLYPQAGNSSPVPSATFAQLLSGRVTITPIPPTLP